MIFEIAKTFSFGKCSFYKHLPKRPYIEVFVKLYFAKTSVP